MSIGPTFECPTALVERLPDLAASRNIRTKIVSPGERDALAVYCSFSRWLGRIDAHLKVGDGTTKIWLTFPRAYAFNPLMWPLNFGLTRKIEELLLENGARRCNWRSFAGEA